MLRPRTVLLASFLSSTFVQATLWCCISRDEYLKCIQLSYHSAHFRREFRCVRFDGTASCIIAIEKSYADVMLLDGGDIFKHRNSLTVVGAEDYGVGDASYYAVTVTKKGSRPELSMRNLAGAKSCHTGVGKSAGWNTPMGYIARLHNQVTADGKMELYDPFVSSCAPGANNPHYINHLPEPKNSTKWCELCVGDDNGAHMCERDSDERYYDYSGAFRCVKEGKGEVAFVKHVTVPVAERDDYELLCPDGTRTHPSKWNECYTARVPSHGVVMKLGTKPYVSEAVVTALQQAMSSVSRDIFFEVDGGLQDLMWKSSTIKFEGPFQKDPKSFLGLEYYCNALAISGEVVPKECIILPLSSAFAEKTVWCCISEDEFSKCFTLVQYSADFRLEFRCVKYDGTAECVEAIEKSEADVMFLDGGDIFKHRKSLTVVAAEDYGVGDASYFAVTVTKKGSRSDLTMLNLVGAKSCHTGVGKSAGWNMPMGFIAKIYNNVTDDGTLGLYDPFVSSCAPGANNSKYINRLPDPTKSSKWCELCVGDGKGAHVCERDSDERYYDYSGAFRCVKEGKGEVAFVKHVTIPETEHDDFELLCPNGTRAHPSKWRECFTARVPSHGMVMRLGTEYSVSESAVKALQQALANAPQVIFFEAEGGLSDLMWKSSTIQFSGPFQKDPKSFLGLEYYCNTLVISGEVVPDECLE